MNESLIKEYFEKYDFFPSKKKGQNFLISKFYAEKIISKLKIEKNDNLLEIGPGFGSLTCEILKYNINLFLVEIDRKIYNFLIKEFKNAEIINCDILKMDLNIFFNENKINKVVSNLPYSVSSKIIVKLLRFNFIKMYVYMVQKEVADRINAKPKSKEYNSLSVLIQTFCKIKKVCNISGECFYPKPQVISTVILLERRDISLNYDEFNDFLKIAFSKKRKTFLNNIKNNFNLIKITGLLKKYNFKNSIRSEEIPVDNWTSIYLDLNNEI
ncbi:MAG: 16S rRNA (adenine(1518)-N(6)/adenine(1519)-N(6))-dimethyltransferase RsmA [Mycoplasmoidaceae bacterium]